MLVRNKFLWCFLLLNLFLQGQLQNAQWYFGNQAGLSFLTSPPTVLTNGQIVTSEGCAAISDAQGNLLFYTSGITIWDRTHAVMANGTGLTGNSSTTQSGIIVKQPGNANIYYVFSLGAGGNATLAYSIVDMNLAAGNGSVITKNVTLSTGMSEKLTSVRHCNGIDTWVVAHENGNNNFKSYLVTSTGVTSTVVTAVGAIMNVTSWAGNMKISPNGRKLAMAMYNLTSIEVLDFDASTGIPSNPMTLQSGTGVFYGTEFSPDGTKLYGTKESGSNALALYQWDLCAGNAAAIAASMYTLAVTSQIMGMQIGIDGKIYIAKYNQNSLAVINNPNAAGPFINYQHSQQSVAPKASYYNLPNFIVSGFKPPPPPFTYTINNAFGCQTALFFAPQVFTNQTTSQCAASGYSLVGMIWNFGDPASGSANTSTLTNPGHAFTNLGTYTTMLVVYYSCGGGTDTIRQVININQPCISVSSTSITCASLGSATVSATGGVGPYSYTWMPGNQTSSVATGLSPGSYTITVYDFGNNFTYTAQTQFNSLVPLTGNISTTSSVSCFGASTGTGQVSGLSGGSGNQNYSWFNGIQTFTTAFTNSLSAGIWSINVTDALTGCQLNQSFLVSQPVAVQPQPATSAASVCVGQSFTLSAGASGGSPFLAGQPYSFAWAGIGSGGTKTVLANISGVHIHTLIALDSMGCSGTATIPVNYVANPTITVASVSICPLSSGTLVASGANSYLWSGNISSSSLVANPAANTQYTVLGSIAGCTAAATADITVNPSPVAVIVSNSPRCAQSNLVLSSGGGGSYTWSGPNNFTGNLVTHTLSQVNVSQGGVYQLTVTSVNGCTASTSASVVVNPIPAVTAAANTVCTSQNLQFSGNAPAGASYAWTGPQNFSSNLQNPNINLPGTNATGNYSLLVTSAQGCTNQAFATAVVLNPPVISVSLNSQSLCAMGYNGSNNTVQVTYSGASTYSFVSGFLQAPALNGPPVICFPSPGSPANVTGSATIIGSNGTCSSSKVFTFNIIANPVVSITPVSSGICLGREQVLTASGTPAFQWLNTFVQHTLSTSGNNMTVQPISTGTYGVYGYDFGCFSDVAIAGVTVNPLPVVSISPTSPSICLNSQVLLSTSGSGQTFQWSPPTGLSASSGNSVMASPATTQSYTVTASANNCTNAAVTTVTVLPLPVPAIEALTPSVCLGGQIRLTGLGGETYGWRCPSTLLVNSQYLICDASTPDFAGTYTLTVTDKHGCKSSTTTVVDVVQLPSAYIADFVPAACQPYCGSFKLEGLHGEALQSNWTINRKKINAEVFSYCFETPGIYTISTQFTDTKTGCSSSDNFYFELYPKPVADFVFVPEKPVELFDEVLFTDRSEPHAIASRTWAVGGLDKFLSGEQATQTFPDAGAYPVALLVKTGQGCMDSVVKIVTVEPDFGLYVPNSFTPNHDSHNDVFMPVMRAIKKYDLKIFNRWGQLLYHGNDPSRGWDGTFRGEDCKQDVYNWKIELSTQDGRMDTKTGTVTLIR